MNRAEVIKYLDILLVYRMDILLAYRMDFLQSRMGVGGGKNLDAVG